MTQKYAFLSDEWTSEFQQIAQELLDASDSGPDAKITYKEHFTNPPAPRTDGKAVGIYLKVADGKVTIRSGVDLDEPTDCTVTMSYRASFATMSVKFGPELTELNKKAYETDELQIEGSLANFPLPMDRLHDAMVEITLPAA